MTDVLRGGAEASRRRSGARRPAAGIALALGALEWRQRYANADEYPLELPTVRGAQSGVGHDLTVITPFSNTLLIPAPHPLIMNYGA